MIPRITNHAERIPVTIRAYEVVLGSMKPDAAVSGCPAEPRSSTLLSEHDAAFTRSLTDSDLESHILRH